MCTWTTIIPHHMSAMHIMVIKPHNTIRAVFLLIPSGLPCNGVLGTNQISCESAELL